MLVFFKRSLFKSVFLAGAVLLSSLAQADEESVRKSVEAFVGVPSSVESVTRTTYSGLYEVVLKSGELVYTDEQVSFLLDGRVIDTRTRRDVTQARLNQLSAIDFSTLPLDQAVKQVKGNGKRVIATFEDPNCGYCKRLAKELTKVNDVTIYTFLYPILSADSMTKSQNIWCAKDKAKIWNDWVLNEKTPPAQSCDASVIDRNVALGQKLKIHGTPTLFLSDGSRIGSFVPAADLEKALDAVAQK